MATANYVSTVEGQPWYAGVKAAMDQAQVPQDVWMATMLTESGGVASNTPTNDPDAAGNPGLSYGLFQLRQPGIGSQASSVTGGAVPTPAQLLDPVTNAQIAAKSMGAAVAPMLNYGSGAELQAVENAGWPGNLTQNQKRMADLATVDSQLGGAVQQTASGNGTAPTDGSDNPGNQSSETNNNTKNQPALQNPLNVLTAWLTNIIPGFEHSLVVFIVIILCAVGGFILIAAAAAQNPNVQNAAKLGELAG